MNPILPLRHFVPDAEARVWKDGRIYIYGSYDISGNTFYCSNEYRVFSSDDLIHWEDHGVSFKAIGPDSDVPWSEAALFAPDCIYKDGTYYLFFCMADNSEGVATSKSPFGPFKNAVPVEGAHKDAIDPAVLLDDDGQAYLYWGQFHLRGAKLKPDMTGIEPETLCTSLLNEKEHGFHEGASIRKRNGIYYLVYTDISRGRATCLSYATSKSPLGPFEKKGVIIDNMGCDPETWNNHGSIAEFKGQWYVFYHRSSQASNYNRRVCIEPIYFDEEGNIKEVEMTTQGVSGYIPAKTKVEACRACLLSGNVRIEPRETEHGLFECLSMIQNGDWAAFKYFNFSENVSRFNAEVSSLTYGGEIEIRVDSPNGPVIGRCLVQRTGGWNKWEIASCPVNNVTGVHAVYLLFKGRIGRLFDLKSFYFE